MLDYQTLDQIADAYVPLLAVFSLALLGRHLVRRQWCPARMEGTLLASGVVVAYGLMLLDTILRLWPSLGLDYSTHTAVALVLVLFLSFTMARLWPLWLVSFFAYAGLMLYQQYHTLLDILTTAVVVGLCFTPAVVWHLRKQSSA